MKDYIYTLKLSNFVESIITIIALITLVVVFSGCSRFGFEEYQLHSEVHQKLDVTLDSEFISTSTGPNTLTKNKLIRNCIESGQTNFDPTNLAYLTDPTNSFSY